MGKIYVNADNASRRPGGVYGNVINKIVEDGVCPFCPEYLAQYHPNPILQDGEHWLYTRNAYPYKGTTHHFLLIHKKHIEHFADITPAAWLELQELMNVIIKEHGITGGALVSRFGDTDYTGASVSHLHAQVVVGPGKDARAEPVLMRVG